ncbi:MAG: Radical SAM domain protein [Parcubacteria group bacterium GW2011_GWD2_40_9]|nr:MAG: Radical SAM domain protein [Parcubacteria group bacterium GW2011_GWD2_40_9]
MIKLCQWDITGECNLNCSYCREKRTEKLTTLNLGQIFSIIDQFVDMEVRMVNIAGGEPLIFKELPKVLSYLRPKVETLGLTTNATLVSNKNVNIIKDFFDGVQVSLDGGNAKIHDSVRGVGTFKKTVSAIELMVKRGINVMTMLTITRQNKHDIANYIKLASSLGLKSAYLRRVIPSGNSRNTEPLSSSELFSVFKIAHLIGRKLNMHVGSADYFSQIYFDKNEKIKVEKNMQDHPGKVLSGY